VGDLTPSGRDLAVPGRMGRPGPFLPRRSGHAGAGSRRSRDPGGRRHPARPPAAARQGSGEGGSSLPDRPTVRVDGEGRGHHLTTGPAGRRKTGERLDRVDAEFVEAVARRVAELLSERTPDEQAMVDAAFVARELSVERDWVYDHATQLGGVRLGGPRGRLRFDMSVVRDRLGGAEPSAWRAPARRARRHSGEARPARRQGKTRSKCRRKSGRRGTAAPPRPRGGPDA
jgi:hypothetical protein